MIRSRLLTIAAMVAMTGSAWAADDKEKEAAEAAAHQAEVVASLSQAAELTAFGRGDYAAATGLKGFKSPEALVAAGGILLRADKATEMKSLEADVVATNAQGKPVKSEASKAVSLKDQANALFDEARAMVAEDKSRTAGIESLIKQASTITESRGSVGGARTITRTLNPGETHTVKIGFIGGQSAVVSMTANGPPNLQFDITHVGGTNLFSLKGKTAAYTWTPVKDANNVRYFNITLYNPGKNPSTYTLVTN